MSATRFSTTLSSTGKDKFHWLPVPGDKALETNETLGLVWGTCANMPLKAFDCESTKNILFQGNHKDFNTFFPVNMLGSDLELLKAHLNVLQFFPLFSQVSETKTACKTKWEISTITVFAHNVMKAHHG